MKTLKISAAAVLYCAALLPAAAQKTVKQKPVKNGYQISGTITNASGKVYLEEMVSPTDFVKKDSAVFNADGSFSMQGKVQQPGLYRLFFGGNLAMLLPVENAKITVGGNTTDLTGTAWSKGTKESEVLQEMRGIRSNTQANVQKLNARYLANQTNQDTVHALMQEAQRNEVREALALRDLVGRNPKSLVSVYTAMAVLNPDVNYAFTDSMTAVFEKHMPGSPYVKMLRDKNENLRSTTVGGVAPEIKLPGANGPEIALSSLRGKYVLIDFWASWCGPCRKENPNVVRLYEQYKNRNFEIFGVSLDKDREKWLQAITADGLTWPQVSDLKFWQSEAAKTYNINSIPATVLLDPQGKIIAKNLRGRALEEKVAELLGE